ncbi:MAG: hypothetical protein IPL65_16685 [Lewinellaceae bacterium]|nr:hypothetical protein [Lewinellaceae bacterium]
MRTSFLFLFGALVLLSSCSPRLTTFNEDLYNAYKWTDGDLKKIQFYLSDNLTIYRNIDEDKGVTIAGGEIKIVNGQKVEQIRFKAGTPGVYLFSPKENHFAISFESGDDSHYLVFGPNPKYDNRYMLLASEWNRRRGKVTYANEKFWMDADVIPRLMVDLKRSGYNKVEVRTAKGRKVE